MKTAIQLLSSVKFLDPKLSAVVTTVEALFKIFGETPIEDELDRFIEDKTDEEIFCECEGTIQYFVSSIIFLSGIGIKSLGDCEFKFVCDNIKPFHGVLLMGKLWKKIDILKNLSIKRRNFTKLMSYIQAYMYLSFMRDLTSVLFCKILEIRSSQNILKGMEVLMNHHKSRDKMLLQFLVEPTKNTLTFNIMYNSNNWPTIDNMLANYFFPKQKTQNPLSYLCDGEFVIKPLKYAGACLYMADIGCTWLRWSDEENEQSRFKFIQHKIDGKIYYQIFSVKWVEYYASMGLASWWARGWKGTPDDYGLWEIISFESEGYPGGEIYMFSQKDSRANFMIVDSCGRVYGSRCLPNVNSFFKIENRFVDALDEIDSDASETTEEYEDCKDVITE